jgi:hypothetical protein
VLASFWLAASPGTLGRGRHTFCGNIHCDIGGTACRRPIHLYYSMAACALVDASGGSARGKPSRRGSHRTLWTRYAPQAIPATRRPPLLTTGPNLIPHSPYQSRFKFTILFLHRPAANRRLLSCSRPRGKTRGKKVDFQGIRTPRAGGSHAKYPVPLSSPLRCRPMGSRSFTA